MDYIRYEINGYTATFRPYLTFTQKRKIQRLIAAAMQVSVVANADNMSIPGSVVYDAQDMAMQMMLVSLSQPDGTSLEGASAYDKLQGFFGEDEQIAEAVYKKLDEMTGRSYLGVPAEDKKKETL